MTTKATQHREAHRAHYGSAPTGLTKWATVVLALAPILEIYVTPVPGLTIARALILATAMFAAISSGRTNPRPANSPLIFAIAVSAISLVAVLTSTTPYLSVSPTLSRMFILLSWGFCIAALVPSMVAFHRLTRIVLSVATVATLYLFTQILAWEAANTVLPSVISAPPVLQPVSEELADVDLLGEKFHSTYYRPSSFFAEPQYYSDYASLALLMALYLPGVRRRALTTTTLTLGLIASTSTTALVTAGVIWISFLLSRAWRVRIPIAAFPLAFLAAGLATYFGATQTTALTRSVSKLSELGSSVRVGGSFSVIPQLEGLEKFVGVGLGQEPHILGNNATYVNSVTAIALGTGALGVMAILWLAWRLMTESGQFGRRVILIYLLLACSGSILYSDRSVLWIAVSLTPCMQVQASALMKSKGM